MNKVKVNHYLNKKLKPFNTGITDTFPVYVRILIGRNVLRIKSPLLSSGDKWSTYFDDEDFNNNAELNDTLTIETKLIKFIINNIDKFKTENLTELVRNLSISICNELLDIDLYLYTHCFEDVNIEPSFFNVLKLYLSEYLSKKTNIEKEFFYNNIDIQNTSDYKIIKKIDFIKNNEIKHLFNIVVLLREFEELNYTITDRKKNAPYKTKKPLNIYEWCFNGAKQKFIDFVDEETKESQIFKNIINSIDFNCKIRIFELKEEFENE